MLSNPFERTCREMERLYEGRILVCIKGAPSSCRGALSLREPNLRHTFMTIQIAEIFFS